jgi:nitrate reductase molybdenum cofactor assembly chaperone NarJ/NarW
MSVYSLLSVLLDYPEQALLDALPEIDSTLAGMPVEAAHLAALVASLRTRPLIESQEDYVATFDRNRAHALHLFEHVHGESRERGQAMVDLLNEYRALGLDVVSDELPDYVPLFLEVLGAIDDARAQALLDDAIHVLAAIGERLEKSGSPYAGVFDVLRGLSGVTPRVAALPVPRDMDDALETLGAGPDGVEPLLTPTLAVQGAQPIHFHPRTNARASASHEAATAKETR